MAKEPERIKDEFREGITTVIDDRKPKDKDQRSEAEDKEDKKERR